MSSECQVSPLGAIVILAGLVLGAALYGASLGWGGRPFVITLGVLALFLAGEVLLAARGVQQKLMMMVRPQRAPLLLLVPFLAYMIYALGTNNFAWSRMGLVALLVLPAALLVASARGAPAGAWQDYAATLALWVPVKIHSLQAALWPYPGHRLTHVMTVVFLLNVAVVLFLIGRRVDGVGYTIGWGRGWGLQVILNLALVAAIVIPLGQAIGFIRFEPQYDQWKALPFALMATLLFTAWPEEFLFRGLLQNVLARTTGSGNAAWLIASVIFGLAHITNGRFPNWRYVILATIAGLFYGRAWRKTGSIFPAAIVHTLVNVTWHVFFRTL